MFKCLFYERRPLKRNPWLWSASNEWDIVRPRIRERVFRKADMGLVSEPQIKWFARIVHEKKVEVRELAAETGTLLAASIAPIREEEKVGDYVVHYLHITHIAVWSPKRTLVLTPPYGLSLKRLSVEFLDEIARKRREERMPSLANAL